MLKEETKLASAHWNPARLFLDCHLSRFADRLTDNDAKQPLSSFYRRWSREGGCGMRTDERRSEKHPLRHYYYSSGSRVMEDSEDPSGHSDDLATEEPRKANYFSVHSTSDLRVRIKVLFSMTPRRPGWADVA